MLSLDVSDKYCEDFVKAEQTFLHQLVYDPKQRKMLPLTPYPNHLNASLIPFCGHYVDENVALQLALGNLDTDTLEKMDTYNPDTQRSTFLLAKNVSIWDKNFTIQELNSSTSFEPQSTKTIPILFYHSTTTKECSMPKTAEQVANISSDHELTACQYGSKSTLYSHISNIRKRQKRDDDEDCLSQNEERTPRAMQYVPHHSETFNNNEKLELESCGKSHHNGIQIKRNQAISQTFKKHVLPAKCLSSLTTVPFA